jgi:rhodanese-related sulfurtransferase
MLHRDCLVVWTGGRPVASWRGCCDSISPIEWTVGARITGGSKVADFRTVSTDELQRRLDRDSGLHLLNVQTGQWFTGELIPGSRRLPLDRIGAQPFAVSKDAEIVTYCRGPQCSQGVEAAGKLVDLGYTNVAVYREGLEGWKVAGNEIVAPQLLPAPDE